MLKHLFGKLYVQVLVGVCAGGLLGVLYPHLGADLKPLGDAFIKLIKMVFAPVIFAMVVLGIAKMESLKELGRVGVRALIYFEVMSTFALLIGLLVVNVAQPGAHMNIDPRTLDTHSIANYTAAASKSQGFVDFLLNMIPTSIVDALAKNDILQILLFATMLGVALSQMGRRAKPVVDLLDAFSNGMFVVVGMIMRLAPVAAFGAIAFTVGKYGLGSLLALGQLMGAMYLTCVAFVFVVLGVVARVSGFSLLQFLRYIKDEIFTVLGTSSSESVVPQLMRKLEHVGVSKPVVGLVVPAGVTFNPDGQCIYYTMAAIFIAQATNTPLTLTDQLVVLGVLMLTSKGSAGVTGSGFITLAATLASMGKIPVAGMVLLLGVDRFMSEARAITNTIGNAVGTVAIARWVGALDRERMQRVLAGEAPLENVRSLYDEGDAADLPPQALVQVKQACPPRMEKPMKPDQNASPERALLRRMFEAAVAAAQPAVCVPPALPPAPKGRLIVIGAGKASAEMARAVERHWPGQLGGLVVTRYGYAVPCERIEIVEAAHPVPDAAGMNAARRMLDLVRGLSPDDLVLCLISGGGSSLLPLPLPGISLEDKQQVNQALLASGASIGEMNCVRRHLSAIKGGRLAAACHPARVLTLLISDVPGDDPRDIASGPTVADASTCADALDIIRRYGITLPDNVFDVLRSGRGESVKPGDPRLAGSEVRLVATPQMALEAAAAVAREAGVTPCILGDSIEGEAREVGKVMAGIALQAARHGQPLAAPCVLLSGGETTVTVRGVGRGGRNVEFLLACAIALRGAARIHGLAGDTDGVDGQEEVAGAWLAPDTLARAWERGLHPSNSLDNNDGHGFFQALGDSVVTGPTLTNVNDFRALLVTR